MYLTYRVVNIDTPCIEWIKAEFTPIVVLCESLNFEIIICFFCFSLIQSNYQYFYFYFHSSCTSWWTAYQPSALWYSRTSQYLELCLNELFINSTFIVFFFSFSGRIWPDSPPLLFRYRRFHCVLQCRLPYLISKREWKMDTRNKEILSRCSHSISWNSKWQKKRCTSCSSVSSLWSITCNCQSSSGFGTPFRRSCLCWNFCFDSKRLKGGVWPSYCLRFSSKRENKCQGLIQNYHLPWQEVFILEEMVLLHMIFVSRICATLPAHPVWLLFNFICAVSCNMFYFLCVFPLFFTIDNGYWLLILVISLMFCQFYLWLRGPWSHYVLSVFSNF